MKTIQLSDKLFNDIRAYFIEIQTEGAEIIRRNQERRDEIVKKHSRFKNINQDPLSRMFNGLADTMVEETMKKLDVMDEENRNAFRMIDEFLEAMKYPSSNVPDDMEQATATGRFAAGGPVNKSGGVKLRHDHLLNLPLK